MGSYHRAPFPGSSPRPSVEPPVDLVKDFAAVAGGTPGKLRKVNLFETSRFFCDVYVLLPGQAQAPHAHAASDKIYAVLGGRGRVRVGAESFDVREGHAVRHHLNRTVGRDRVHALGAALPFNGEDGNNPDLKPSKATSYSLGFVQVPG